MDCWVEPFVQLRIPKIFNLRRDPFERADENSNTYWDWLLNHAFMLIPAQALVAQQIQSFKDFPPRQKPASFNLDRVLEQLQNASGAGARLKSHLSKQRIAFFFIFLLIKVNMVMSKERTTKSLSCDGKADWLKMQP